ncbi:MAG: polysaccharide biosynthesis tyrosine autokinase [Reichenbachiella sp.]
MNPRNIHILQDSGQNKPQEDENPLDNIDFDKIRQVVLKGLPWVIAILIITNTLAFLYLRYTKPIYSSESILKLDIKSDAGMLGLQNPIANDIKGISGEIEILKSRLFFSKVVDAVDLNVSYYHPGRSHLVDERYGNSPFLVKYTYVSPTLKDRQIELDIVSDSEYLISYDQVVKKKYKFGERIKTEQLDCVIEKTRHFDSQKNAVDFYFIINSKESLIDYLSRNVSVQPLNLNANTIKISFSDNSQLKAQRMVQAIDTIYLTYTRNAKNLAGEQKIDFLNSQMSKTAQELEEYEEYFEKFTIKHRTTDLAKDLTTTIVMLNQLDSQRFVLRSRVTSIELISDQIEKDQPISASNIPERFSQVVGNYDNLMKERELKLRNYNENTQVIQQIDHQIELTKRSILTSLKTYRSDLIKRQEELKRNRLRLENNFVELPSRGTSYNKNRRLYSLQEEFYFSMIKTKIELEIAKAGTVTNFVVLSPASFPQVPIHPRKILIYGAGMAAGLVISFVFLALSYLLHDKITSQKELERLISAPILGVVPKYMKEKLEMTRLVVNNNPKSSISESLRAIRTNMDFLSPDKEAKMVSITSTVSGEGKTFIAVNLGAIFAYSGKKVVIVDLDMRKPKVHKAFQAEQSKKGISTILIGRHKMKECLQQSDVENLNFIQAGTTPPNPSELILSSHFDELLETLKKEFDVVILDTPPVGLVTDGILVMKKCDLPIYVVRSEYSRKSYAKAAQRLIQNNHFNHISVILNSVRSKGQYGYGYSYGQGYYDDDGPKGILNRIFNRS